MTNAGVSGETDLQLKEQLRLAGVAKILVLGATWIEQQIREHKNLRMMVPRVYGLGDLSQILDERAYGQATAVLESMRDDLAKVVVTDSYRKAAKALNEHRFVLIIGEPAAGKTTIASMLAMASADKWGASVVKVDDPKSVVDHWNPKEKSQLFWIDDAFGVTQFESALVAGWNHRLPQMRTILSQGSSIIMTSRDYIYKSARRELKEGTFPLFRESQTIVDVQDLTMEERTQILYNHLKLGRQPQAFRSAIKEYLPHVAQHRRFIPEIARRLSEPLFTTQLSLSGRGLDEFVERRKSLLIEICEGLDSDCKAALALVYMRKSKLLSPIDLTSEEDQAIRRLNSTLGACTAALEALNGSLIVHLTNEGEAYWSFKHPTIGDAYASILRHSPELLGIYLQGVDADKLVGQVTCGDMQIEGAVVLPKSLFGLVIERLHSYEASPAYKTKHLSSWYADRSIKYFLAKRCSKEFLEMYLPTNPKLLESIASPIARLEYSADIDLAVRLFELKLLPEELRQSLAEVVSEYAWQGHDPWALIDPRLGAMLNGKEKSRLEHAVRTKLLPRIAEVRLTLQKDYLEGEDAEWHMGRFNQYLSALEDQYFHSRRIGNIVKRERLRTREWIEHRRVQASGAPMPEISTVEERPLPASTRNVFDDVDE
jgi:energy-coupling factor transporter ATP-binding protein EcfA2